MPYKDPKKLKEWCKKNDKEKRTKRRTFLNRYKFLCGCRLCGYKKSSSALEFHHKDEALKEHALSKMVDNKLSLKTIKEEARKCVILCANCHREVHDEIRLGIIHDWY